ncbi:D-glycero-alpha-D-manno-heptose-7-phosphate kinase [Myxococcaceae bacterium]|nr:D-glycero-alpha-D-manno-heptose-7-phosphate kinase [Myxococcaceae bacterium]
MTRRRIVVSAPGRANLIGNPSDLYGGRQVSCSLALRARASLEAGDGTSLATSGLETRICDAADLDPRGDLLDLGRAVLRFVGPPLPRARIDLASEIPLASGLAGSAALVVALLRALRAWRGEPAGGHRLAEEARSVERDGMGAVCGFGDPYMAVFGGLRFLDFRGKGYGAPGERSELATVEDLGPFVAPPPFIVASTGIRHSSSAVHAPICERWRSGEREVVAGYERVSALGAIGKSALLDGDWAVLGAAMNENHAIQRSFGGSGPANERLIDAALEAGAPGAKLAGAGQGGTIVVLWPVGDRAPLERALLDAGAVALHPVDPVEGVRIDLGI